MDTPLAVKIPVCPGQIVAPETEIETPVPIVTELVICVVQLPLAPIKETVVVDAGLIVKVFPVTFPGNHVYVVAPLPVNVAVCPAQIVVANGVKVGVGVTLTVDVIEFVQTPLLPVTVYVAVVFGLTEIVLVVCPPACHVKLVAVPEAVNVVEFPEQMVVFPVIASVGCDATVTVTVFEFEHDPLLPVTV